MNQSEWRIEALIQVSLLERQFDWETQEQASSVNVLQRKGFMSANLCMYAIISQVNADCKNVLFLSTIVLR